MKKDWKNLESLQNHLYRINNKNRKKLEKRIRTPNTAIEDSQPQQQVHESRDIANTTQDMVIDFDALHEDLTREKRRKRCLC